MNNRPSISVPDELVQQWTSLPLTTEALLVIAYRAGADMELEACCEWLGGYTSDHMAIYFLRDARRPKLPSETDLALAALNRQETRSIASLRSSEDCETVRRCLERLKKLEESTND